MDATAFVIEMPLRTPYETAGHEVGNRRGVIVRVSDGETAGWGEFGELPGYSPETVETALATLAGSPVTHSNPMAIAARRIAKLDLEAKQTGKPLTNLLGGSPGPVQAGAVVARFGDLAAVLDEAGRRLSEGYSKLKIKIGPGFDLAPLSALRSQHPDALLAADANGAYQSGQVPIEIDEIGLAYLEQPYPSDAAWSTFAQLRSRLTTPLCLDESITGLPTLRSAIAGEACDVVNLKPARLTGLRQAVELHDLAVAAGLGLVAGGLLETGIGRAAVAALARLPGFVFPSDLAASRRYWNQDLTVPEWELSDGNLDVSERPGIGVAVDPDRLAAVTVAEHQLPG
ncbi:MAG: enolase C-terminal domain-like protein [Acidimicrobiia bacterium]